MNMNVNAQEEERDMLTTLCDVVNYGGFIARYFIVLCYEIGALTRIYTSAHPAIHPLIPLPS
jgi:hypothetical protein